MAIQLFIAERIEKFALLVMFDIFLIFNLETPMDLRSICNMQRCSINTKLKISQNVFKIKNDLFTMSCISDCV